MQTTLCFDHTSAHNQSHTSTTPAQHPPTHNHQSYIKTHPLHRIDPDGWPNQAGQEIEVKAGQKLVLTVRGERAAGWRVRAARSGCHLLSLAQSFARLPPTTFLSLLALDPYLSTHPRPSLIPRTPQLSTPPNPNPSQPQPQPPTPPPQTSSAPPPSSPSPTPASPK